MTRPQFDIPSASPSGQEFQRALGMARRYLRFGTHSTAQLRTYLQARGIPQRLIDPLAAACVREGLLDDRASAKLWAATLEARGYAWAAIREQLREKGFDERLIAEVLAPLQAAADDVERARELAMRSRSTRAASQRAERARLARRLAQRGFDADVIEQVLAERFGMPAD